MGSLVGDAATPIQNPTAWFDLKQTFKVQMLPFLQDQIFRKPIGAFGKAYDESESDARRRPSIGNCTKAI